MLLQEVATRRQHCFMSNSGSSCTLSLWESWLPGLWLRVECAWANTQELVSLLLPLKASPLPFRLIPAWGTAACWNTCTQKRGFSWGPQQQGTWRPGDFSKGLMVRGSSYHSFNALESSPSQGKPNSTGLRGGSIKDTWPYCVSPSPIQSCDPSLIRVQVCQTAHV